MGKVISFTNQKGGVGKTSLAFNFGVGLSKCDAKVLFIDMDPQCNLSYIMGAKDPENTSFELLCGEADARSCVLHLPEGDLIPASNMLSTIDAAFEDMDDDFEPPFALSNAINSIKDDYEFIVIDSPPTLGTLTVNLLTASDEVIIPVLADVFSLQAIDQLTETITAIKENCNENLTIGGIVLSRYLGRQKLGKKIIQQLEDKSKELNCYFFKNYIRESVVIREAELNRMSIFKYAPKGKQTDDINQLIIEYLKKEIEEIKKNKAE